MTNAKRKLLIGVLAGVVLFGLAPSWSAAASPRPAAPPVVFRATNPLTDPGEGDEEFRPASAISVSLLRQPTEQGARQEGESTLDILPGPESIGKGNSIELDLVPLRDVQIHVPHTGKTPENYAQARFDEEALIFDMPGSCRGWAGFVYAWQAPSLCYGPLYFEETNLERYGHQLPCIVQPWVSAAHFFATVPALPYLAATHPPCECIYPLGHYRPGNCVPYHCNCLPVSPRGAAAEAGVLTGLIFLIP